MNVTVLDSSLFSDAVTDTPGSDAPPTTCYPAFKVPNIDASAAGFDENND